MGGAPRPAVRAATVEHHRGFARPYAGRRFIVVASLILAIAAVVTLIARGG